MLSRCKTSMHATVNAAKPKEEGGLPSIELPDANAILAEEQAIIQAEVEEIENGFKTLEEKWQEKSKTLPQQERLDEFKARWEALKEKNTFERIAEDDIELDA